MVTRPNISLQGAAGKLCLPAAPPAAPELNRSDSQCPD